MELYGGNEFEMAIVDSWLELLANDLEVACCLLVYPILGYSEYNEQVWIKATSDTKTLLQHLESCLTKSPYLCGDKMTLADIAGVSILALPFKMIWDEKFRQPYRHIVEWFMKIMSMQEFVEVWGRWDLCKVEQQCWVHLKKEKDKKKQEETKKEKAQK